MLSLPLFTYGTFELRYVQKCSSFMHPSMRLSRQSTDDWWAVTADCELWWLSESRELILIGGSTNIMHKVQHHIEEDRIHTSWQLNTEFSCWKNGSDLAGLNRNSTIFYISFTFIDRTSNLPYEERMNWRWWENLILNLLKLNSGVPTVFVRDRISFCLWWLLEICKEFSIFRAARNEEWLHSSWTN